MWCLGSREDEMLSFVTLALALSAGPGHVAMGRVGLMLGLGVIGCVSCYGHAFATDVRQVRVRVCSSVCACFIMCVCRMTSSEKCAASIVSEVHEKLREPACFLQMMGKVAPF